MNSIKTQFNRQNPARQVSLADLIILGGNAAIEAAAAAANHTGVRVPFTPGRVDATQADTDIAAFELLRPAADGFRNFRDSGAAARAARTEDLLVDRAAQLTLTAPQTAVLVGGLRVLGATAAAARGVLTLRPGRLTNDFFVHLLDADTVWAAEDAAGEWFAGRGRATGRVRWTATRADLVFGSHAELRAIAEVYAEEGGQRAMVDDFVEAWVKVMNLDRFDVKK